MVLKDFMKYEITILNIGVIILNNILMTNIYGGRCPPYG